MQWYNGLSNNTKTIIGIAFFALACAITAVVTYLTGGGGTGIITALWDMTVKFAIGVVTAAAISGVIALCSGGDIAEAITSAAADAILTGGIIAFVSAGVNAVKTVVRSVRNAKLIGSSQTGAQPQSTVNVNQVKPDLGNKLDYAFGKASGNPHSISRSMDNAAQLSKIGIYDNTAGRQILVTHFTNTFYANQSLIINSCGRVSVESLLAGPGGFLGVKSVWQANKLITFIFIGG